MRPKVRTILSFVGVGGTFQSVEMRFAVDNLIIPYVQIYALAVNSQQLRRNS
jgi:hypothetical protein